MLRSLDINSFTVFSPQTDFTFAKGINVIIGENGLGKSHLLKLAYSVVSVCEPLQRNNNVNKQQFQRAIARKLVGVFRPDYLGRLTSRKSGRTRCEIGVHFFANACNYHFSFASNSREEVTIDERMVKLSDTTAIFLPTMEIISIFPGFSSLYREKHLSFDETYYDLCLALERSLSKGARYDSVRKFLDPIEEILQGRIRCENGRFYLTLPGTGNMEMPLVAEGHRKLATIAYLLANGSILKNGILFWDEPETNLNPALMRDLAKILIHLANMGIQIFLTSHNLFFIKELDLQLQIQRKRENGKKGGEKIPSKWFAFSAPTSEKEIQISSGNALEEVEPIRCLDVELEQSEAYYRFTNENYS